MRAISHTETDSDISRLAFDAFCTNLLKGLHAAAQPLTILRAGLSTDCTGRMNLEELRDQVETSATEIERLCELFSTLKQFIQAEQFEANCTSVPLLPLLTKSLEEFHTASPGAEMTVSVPETLPDVVAESKHAAQVIFIMLKMAHALAGERSLMELTANVDGEAADIQLNCPQLQLHALNAENSLLFALAEARIRSQGGRLTYSLKPFTITATFQVAQSKDEGKER